MIIVGFPCYQTHFICSCAQSTRWDPHVGCCQCVHACVTASISLLRRTIKVLLRASLCATHLDVKQRLLYFVLVLCPWAFSGCGCEVGGIWWGGRWGGLRAGGTPRGMALHIFYNLEVRPTWLKYVIVHSFCFTSPTCCSPRHTKHIWPFYKIQGRCAQVA